MKKIYLILFFFLSSARMVLSQEQPRNFNSILQSYYLYKDKDLVEKTVDFVNHTTMDVQKLTPIFTGFFGALYDENDLIKKAMGENIVNIKNIEIRKLLSDIGHIDIDSLYRTAARNTIYNDMNWSSYFSSGKTKYLDHIISNIPYVDERSDVNLFLAGATAKWSLCSNARQHATVKQYLISLGDKNKHVIDILNHEPGYFREQMIGIIKEQKAKGLWNQ